MARAQAEADLEGVPHLALPQVLRKRLSLGRTVDAMRTLRSRERLNRG